MPTVRAKYVVEMVNPLKGDNEVQVVLKPAEEGGSVFLATRGRRLDLIIDAGSIGEFQLGREFFMDVSPVPEPVPA